jgi:hypothetical protein
LLRFTGKYGTTVENFAQSTGVEMSPYRDFEEFDYGANECGKNDRPKRHGAKASLSGKF